MFTRATTVGELKKILASYKNETKVFVQHEPEGSAERVPVVVRYYDTAESGFLTFEPY